MPNKEFLENYSLYRKYRVTVPHHLNDFLSPAINMECSKCNSAQTFNMKGG